MVDKNLFPYELAVVTIIKNEAPYVKEWLDYHLLAGADHFYIYDNDSTDNLKDILQPYIYAGTVTYIFYPGKVRQMEAYNDAAKRFRFFCRYMTWIDADEFVFPKSKTTIPEVVDEILTSNPDACAVAANILTFGSNKQDKADYTRGVLERFTRRAENNWSPPAEWNHDVKAGNAHISTIANPRRVKVFCTPHAPYYFTNCFAVNEKGKPCNDVSNFPVLTKKISMHHYHTKSREEYQIKIQRGNADHLENGYDMARFKFNDRNEVFDDSILKYLHSRQKQVTNFEYFIGTKNFDSQRIAKALSENLSRVTKKETSQEFFEGKMENFLTCLTLSMHLKENYPDVDNADVLMELSLAAIYRAIYTNLPVEDFLLLIDELPKILAIQSRTVEKIRQACVKLIPQLMVMFRQVNKWWEFRELNYVLELLGASNSKL